LPLTRPDLHFLYNLIEPIPLVLAFALEIRRAQAAGVPRRRSEPAEAHRGVPRGDATLAS
jgi:hypothetical protein